MEIRADIRAKMLRPVTDTADSEMRLGKDDSTPASHLGRSGSLPAREFHDTADDSLESTQLMATRLSEGLFVCLVATAFLLLGDILLGYSETWLIAAIQMSTVVLLTVLLRELRRFPSRTKTIGIGWLGLGTMCFGTAIIGIFDQEAFTTSTLMVALAMTTATLVPWGGWAQVGAVLPMTPAYAYLLYMADGASAWGPRLPVGVAVVLGASVYIAHHLERERNAVTMERQRRSQENRRLLEQLERANQTKSEFVATMSHELRTPLNVILGYNDLLADGTMGSPTSEQSDALARVRANALELLELVNATLDLNRLEAGSVSVNSQFFQLSDLTDEIDAQVRMLLAEGVDLQWHFPAGYPPICSDVAKLKVILKNLTTNAIKFTKAGAVTVSFDVCDDDLLMEVADTGIGMTEEAAKIVFQPFQQADASIQRDFGGAGLGLHIVSRLVDVMGGSIELDSELGKGTTVRVHLPQQQGMELSAA